MKSEMTREEIQKRKDELARKYQDWQDFIEGIDGAPTNLRKRLTT
jgi:hypothetical protein